MSSGQTKRVMFIENSVSTTGAWISGLSMVEELLPHAQLALLLPRRSALHAPQGVFELGEHRLRMLQLGRSLVKLMLYWPCLLMDAWQLLRMLRKMQIDVLIVNDYYNLLACAVRCMGWRGRIVTWVKLRPCKQNPVLNRLWIAAAMLCSDLVAAVSDAVMRDLPVHPKVRKLGNPHNLSEKHPEWSSQPDEALGVWFLFPANYIHGKGHDMALSAFSIAYRRNPLLRLRFVGAEMGLAKNRQYKRELQAQAEFLGLADVIEFDGFSPDIEREMKSAHVVLNFSESESFSNTCLEAGFFHRPVIATRCGGPEEIIEEGVTGFLVELKDVKQMAGRMLHLAADEGLRQRMGEAAHERTDRLFVNIDSWPMCQALLGLEEKPVGIGAS